ncbi:MAG: ribonuclease P protein component [Pseudomonadales bacterium]|nr:ribonuclease P protein component [Pseudomonadales bacterium]
MTSTGFPKASRLLNASDFDAVFANNQFKVANRHFLVLALNAQISSSRLGMVVAKKNIPLAVQRNRIRRLIRDSFRNSSERLEQLDIVVLVRKGTDKLGNPEIRSSLETLWRDLEKKHVAA